MTSARLSAAPTTALYRLGDRVTDVFDTSAGPRRYTGTILDSTALLFDVVWDDNAGRARYTHGAEPSTLRHARPGDEPADYAAAIAGELAKILAAHPHWPWQVRSVLEARRRNLGGAA